MHPRLSGRPLNVSSGGTWTPAELSSAPKLWYNDDSTAYDAGGGLCSGWDDLSGNNATLIQNGPTAQPLIVAAAQNGRRIIRFDGTTDNLINDNITNYARTVMQNVPYGWAMAIYKKNGSDGGGTARVIATFTTGAVSGTIRFGVACGNNANTPALYSTRVNADSTATLNGTTARTGVWVMALYITDYANSDGFVWINGELESSNTSFTTTGNTSDTISDRKFMIGGWPGNNSDTPNVGFPADMDLGELIIGSGTTLSSGDIDRLFGYAAHRWGLTANLDISHPYKSTPP